MADCTREGAQRAWQRAHGAWASCLRSGRNNECQDLAPRRFRMDMLLPSSLPSSSFGFFYSSRALFLAQRERLYPRILRPRGVGFAAREARYSASDIGSIRRGFSRAFNYATVCVCILRQTWFIRRLSLSHSTQCLSSLSREARVCDVSALFSSFTPFSRLNGRRRVYSVISGILLLTSPRALP